jgi:hypothetical protein
MKREIAKSRPESRPRPWQRRDYFLGFMFKPQNRRELSNFAQTRSRSRREDFSSVRDQARSLSKPIHTPPQQPTWLKTLEFCVQWRFWDLSGTCGDHMVTLVIFPTFSQWRRVPFFRALYFRESLFLMHECLNRDHHSCDKPFKAKVFFILYPSLAV